MLERFRAAWQRILTPLAKRLLSWGAGPDLITWLGTLGAVGFAVICYPQGWLWVGSVGIGFFAFSDMLDGQMARLSGRQSRWGAFLDSSLDRVADGAIFGGIVLYFAGPGDSVPFAAVTLVALVMGQVTSYVKARAETVDIKVPGGIAARADRILFLLPCAFAAGLGVPWILQIAVSVLAAATLTTVVQRVASVYRQTRGVVPAEPSSTPPAGLDHPPAAGPSAPEGPDPTRGPDPRDSGADA